MRARGLLQGGGRVGRYGAGRSLAGATVWLWGAATPVGLFVADLQTGARGGLGLTALVLLMMASLFWMASTLWIAVAPRFSLALAARQVLFAALWLVEGFASAYWNIGTARNFGKPLTHLDTVYIALGNLTTAGSGSLVPRSEAARLVFTVQYGVDMVFVLLVIGAFIGRIGARRRSSEVDVSRAGGGSA